MSLNLDLISKNTDLKKELEKYIENDADKEVIIRCLRIASEAHKNKFRISGDLSITHSLWVAKIVAQLKVGREAVLAALLHDSLTNTELTLEEIAKDFGDEVALLVDGLNEIKRKTKGRKIKENNIDFFRRFLFSSVNDVRILIIRLIDKLHNGLTCNSLPIKKQKIYAKNVFLIYGPVAEYVGLHYFKKLLEDMAFKILYPEETRKIEQMFEEGSKDEIKASNLVRNDLNKIMKLNNINNFIIEGRIKSFYSTYLKIQKKGLEKVKDRVGIRILTGSVEDCYTILGLLHSKYEHLHEELNDYIAFPKPNGYRSIQTTINWKDKQTIEIQIKTKGMHEFNEFGPASHIAYKLGKGSAKGVGMEWVKDLVKWQQNDNNINNYRIKVLIDFIYVFTPKDDVVQMPEGSTVLDFAYKIHSDIGNHCYGAKVNGKIEKINSKLKTGDVVEILVNKKLHVSKNWLSEVKTRFAKERIRKNFQ